MSQFNADFWEVPMDAGFLENTPAERALWFETEEDRARRHAFKDFFQDVSPVIREYINTRLTPRQQEVVDLYFFRGKTQEDIAAMLDLTQSTVSRHLFGTTRDGKKIGGAVPKLRKIVQQSDSRCIHRALESLDSRLAAAM